MQDIANRQCFKLKHKIFHLYTNADDDYITVREKIKV